MSLIKSTNFPILDYRHDEMHRALLLIRIESDQVTFKEVGPYQLRLIEEPDICADKQARPNEVRKPKAKQAGATSLFQLVLRVNFHCLQKPHGKMIKFINLFF